VWHRGKTLNVGSASSDGAACYARKGFCQGGVFFGKVAKQWSSHVDRPGSIARLASSSGRGLGRLAAGSEIVSPAQARHPDHRPGHRSDSRFSTIQYSVGELTCRFKSWWYLHASVGAPVAVLYLPGSPESGAVNFWQDLWMPPILWSSVAVFFGVLDIWY
jgi:hypothetical protein